MENNQDFTITSHITNKTVEDLLVSAFEGGSNYWYDNLEPNKRTSTDLDPSIRFYSDLMEHGFNLTDKLGEDRKLIIGRDAMARALQLMHNNHGRHFGDVLADNMDADTGDVFLQLACFGDVIYG